MTKRIMATGLSLALAFGLVAFTAPVLAAAAPRTIRIEEEQIPLGAPKNVKKGQSLYAAKATKLFKAASTKADKVADIKAYDKVTVVKSSGSWIQVKAGSKTGYVQSKLFELTYKAQASGKVQTIKKVALRQTASAKARAVATVPAKKTLTIVQVSGRWVKVTYNGQAGFIDEKSFVVTGQPQSGSGASKISKSASTNVLKSQQQAPTSDRTTASIDSANASKGLVQVKILTHTGKTLKFMMKKKDTVFMACPALAAPSTYPLTMGDGKYNCAVIENISGNQYGFVQSADITAGSSDDKYLASTPNIYFTSAMAPIKTAAQLCAGKKSDNDKVKAIFDWVAKNVDYDKNKILESGATSSIESTYRTGKGVCKDYAVLFAAMCRSQGIKTKYMTGFCKPVGNYKTYHAWNQVYINGQWRTTDTCTSAANGQSMFVSSGYKATSSE